MVEVAAVAQAQGPVAEPPPAPPAERIGGKADGTFETIPAFGLPAINTAILLTSGVTITIAHHALKAGNRRILMDTGLGEFGGPTTGKLLEQLRAAGFQPLTLGARVLRADTAPLALLAHLAIGFEGQR